MDVIGGNPGGGGVQFCVLSANGGLQNLLTFFPRYSPSAPNEAFWLSFGIRPCAPAPGRPIAEPGT